MLQGKKPKEKKMVPALAVMKKVVSPLFEKRPKNFGTGQDIQPKRGLTCFAKWPHYIRLQKQRDILYKVHPGLDHEIATQMLKLAHKYRPETKQENKQRLLAWAEKKTLGKGDVPTKRLPVLQAEVNTVTTLVENKKAQLEKDRPGASGPLEGCTTVAFTQVNSEDKGALARLVETIKTNDTGRYDEICFHLGGNILGPKLVPHIAKLEKAKAKELVTKPKCTLLIFLYVEVIKKFSFTKNGAGC
ncbi:60s ribosomal protein l7a-like [Lynx pardinus]|uniref:60S ribosomal protein L7a n=1 Tax=Lynx pardinus TaxID=191816 RepID=A0A485P9L7_LYNPA|nr:60s ribosomal protein l7a-like [Lynx pardinus]